MKSTLNSQSGPLDITFTAVLGKVREGDTWTCVQLPNSAEVSPSTSISASHELYFANRPGFGERRLGKEYESIDRLNASNDLSFTCVLANDVEITQSTSVT
jgi:hypothetical protein